jgi:hypothetical protein
MNRGNELVDVVDVDEKVGGEDCLGESGIENGLLGECELQMMRGGMWGRLCELGIFLSKSIANID